MKNFTHTPGPWRLINASIRGYLPEQGEISVARVTEWVTPYVDMTKANAHEIKE